MYVPVHFSITSNEELHRIIRTYPLGALITRSEDGLDANHLPFEFDPDRGEWGTLTAHVARANPVWQQCSDGSDVLVIFRGSEGYISPSWYPSKHELHRQVPTWNYEVVHAHGRMRIREDEKFVRRVVARLTHTHEAQEPQPWKMGDAEPAHLAALLQSIVGIEIAVTRFEGKAKLSQNREMRDRQGAADALREREQHGLADAMTPRC